MNIVFLTLLCTVAFALIRQSALDDLASGKRKLSAFEYENTRLKQTNSVLVKAMLRLTAADSQPSIPSMKCSKMDARLPSYVSSECLEEFIKLVSFLNDTSCLANDMSQRIAEAYVPLNACVNVSSDFLMPGGFGPTGLKKFSCDSKKLMAEPCDSIEYSSSFAAILERPSNASYAVDQNQTFSVGWGLCTNLTSWYGWPMSTSSNCVDGFVNEVWFDDDKCSISKANMEIKGMNMCVETFGKSVMMCNEEMMITLACADDSFALPVQTYGPPQPPVQNFITFGCKNDTESYNRGFSTEYLCNITTNVLDQYKYYERNCASGSLVSITPYELDKKCLDLGPDVIGWGKYSTTTSDCHTFYRFVPCFAHDSNWKIYGTDDFVCNATGKNCTTKKNYHPLTLTEVTSVSIPKYKLMFPSVQNAIAGGGKTSTSSTTKTPSKGSSEFNTKKLVAVTIVVVCLALAGAFLAYYYCCTGNKKADGSIQPRLSYESMH